MRFCPGCGLALQEGDGPGSAAGREGAIRFSVPQQQMYPMPYPPMPGMYPMSPSGRRSQAIAAGVIMLITAGFLFIGGIYYMLDAWWFTDFWAFMAVLCFASFAYCLVGALGLFRARWRVHSLLSCILMAFVGFLTILDLEFLSIIIIVMSIVSISLVAMSWRQMEEMRMMSALQASMMQQQMPPGMFPGFPPPAAPPASPPVGSQPPPRVSALWDFDEGAVPPPSSPAPVEDEEVVAFVDPEGS
jgi:hypothetical protein